jgi:hypothetical protein
MFVKAESRRENYHRGDFLFAVVTETGRLRKLALIPFKVHFQFFHEPNKFRRLSDPV